MKCRLAGPPLDPPGVPVTGDQAIPQQAADGAGPQPHRLDELPVVRDQDTLNVGGVQQQKGAQKRQAQGDDRPIPRAAARQEAERVLPQRGQVAQQRVSRRRRCRRHREQCTRNPLSRPYARFTHFRLGGKHSWVYQNDNFA